MLVIFTMHSWETSLLLHLPERGRVGWWSVVRVMWQHASWSATTDLYSHAITNSWMLLYVQVQRMHKNLLHHVQKQ